MSTVRDPYLSLPLDGIHAIEASAGTGKTFTLATLVLRLVVERGLRIGQVLAVTFTEAATQELRSRLRQRLLLAAQLAGVPSDEAASPEAATTHAILAAHLARGTETPAALQARLREAADSMDLAAVFTIHGFCARVLREHALESGQGFDAPELLANDAALRDTIAADLWRAHGSEADGADDLLALWKGGPEALAADLPLLVRERVLRPQAEKAGKDPAPALQLAGDALADDFRAHGDDFRAALVDAVEAKVLHGGSYRLDWIAALFDAVKAWCDAGDATRVLDHPKLPNLRRDTLREKTNAKGAGRTPDSPICDALHTYLDALAAVAAYRESRRVARLHRIRDDARARLAQRTQQLRVQTYDDLIDRVADAIEGPGGDALAAQLRAQYAVALVDEFQDTDPRQWRIFDRVFGSGAPSPALFVIGDPKQAIYGFRGGDVETYLAAKQSAEDAPPLSANFRSRPTLLQAVQALYAQAGETAFLDTRIRFHDVTPGGTRSDDDFLRNGIAAPALTLWQAPVPEPDAKGKAKAHSAGTSRELATAACTAAIHAVLSDARQGNTTLQRKDGRTTPVQPGDIAVLVRTHAEATRIRTALAEAGIPAVAAGKQSLFATPEAADLHALLLALLHGADEGRLRRALATLLVGVDAQGIAALDSDGEALHAWQLRALQWRERLDRGGPLALVNALCAERAPQLLALFDGERRLTNYLQLGEQLQEAQAHALGLHGLVDWLARAMAEADVSDDSQLLRLESDARRVQIVTLHKSKGLEYPLVFLPFAGIGRNAASPGARVVVHEATHDDAHDAEAEDDAPAAERVLHWKLQEDTSGWEAAKRKWIEAQRAEDTRLLYVGLTRAEHALWLATGPLYAHDKSPLAGMVGNRDALRAALGDALVVDDAAPPAPSALPLLPTEATAEAPRARTAAPLSIADWWVYSFSQLSKAEAGGDASSAATEADPGGRDEASDAVVAGDVETPDLRFGGTGFGVVLHAALEHADFARWSAWHPGDNAPAGEDDNIARALREGGYAEADLPDGQALLASLVGHTLTTQLPEGLRLADVPVARRRAEIEFQFALQPTRVDALLRLLHAHGVVSHRHGFGLRRRLEGLMTGLIDLTYHVDGRWYVLDYKSNRLPRYDAPALVAAMAHGEYDLQALIYTLALHRWLRFRMGDAYDYARDFGGIRYLFCRGLDATHADARTAPGIVAHRYAPELVHALDALFAGNGETEAAA